MSPFFQLFTRFRISACVLALTVTAAIAGPIPPDKPAAYPAWWFTQDVIPRINPANATPSYTAPGTYPPADDYAVANIGQLKYIATKAASEFNATLLPGGAGTDINNLISSWNPSTPNPARDDYTAVNLGQVKTVTEPFYARLQQLGYTGQPLTAGQTRPWSGTADDFALANLGQIKHLFSFNPLIVDSIAPSTPVGLSSSIITPSSFTLNWSASTDNTGVVGYDIYLDGVKVASSLTTSFTFANLADTTTYSMSVRARDAAGNVSGSSSALVVLTSSYQISEQVSVGKNHTLALKKDGTVWAWGRNDYGQLGQGSLGEFWYPAKVESLSTVKAVSAGADYSLALKSDGTVWAWGSNDYGQLGQGNTAQRQSPTLVSGLTGVVAISAGEGFSLALKSDGTVWAWGFNAYKQLGDGTATDRPSPVPVSGLNDVIAIDSGYYHGVALKLDGTVWVWGANYYGVFGTNSIPSNSSTPIPSGTIANVSAIAAGDYHMLALKGDGSVWAWGLNGNGQLGDNTTTYSRGVAGAVVLTGQYKSIAAGVNNSAALRTDGTLYTWGQNNYGQIGNGTIVDPVRLPTAVAGLSSVTAIATGQHTLAANPQGQLFSWGYNLTGQLGQGSKTNQSTPSILQSFTQVGQLGLPVLAPEGGSYLNAPTVTVRSPDISATLRYTIDGTEPNGGSPVIASGSTLVTVSGFLKVKAFRPGSPASETKTAVYQISEQVSVGKNHTLALKKDGTVWAWGRNDYGQLGQGSLGEFWYPAKVESLSTVKAVSAGADYSLALKSDGTVWAWGSNDYGQLGQGNTAQRQSPTLVSGLTGVVAISAGEGFSLALKSDGTVWAWGFNAYKQLGDGTATDRPSPVPVSGLNDVIAIDSGYYHGVALKLDGTVWVWGANYYGVFGTNSIPSNSSTPIPSGTIANVSAIAAGDYHMLALKGDGSVWAWGLNGNGQLGDNTTTYSRGVAGAVVLTGQYKSIAAGVNNSAALRTDGTLYTWGQNNYGQIGNGTIVDPVRLPTAVAGLSSVTAIATGQHTLAARNLEGIGILWSWGYNQYRQVGDNSVVNRLTPVLVKLPYDADSDGIPDWQEYDLSSDPLLYDTNGDGMGDGLALQFGYSLIAADTDVDGISNVEEVRLGLDPLHPDSDRDGVADNIDIYPLDPTRNALPTPAPGDTTAPIITITAPLNAVLIP